MKIYSLPYNTFLYDLPVGTEKLSCGLTQANYIAEQGQILLTKEYPGLFKYAVENRLIVTEEEWQSEKLFAVFAYGETSDTFRLPDKRGLSAVGFEQGYHNRLGEYVQDQIVNITGDWFCRGVEYINSPVYRGAFYLKSVGSDSVSGHARCDISSGLGFDASRVIKTGDRVQVRGFTVNWLIKYR